MRVAAPGIKPTAAKPTAVDVAQAIAAVHANTAATTRRDARLRSRTRRAIADTEPRDDGASIGHCTGHRDRIGARRRRQQRDRRQRPMPRRSGDCGVRRHAGANARARPRSRPTRRRRRPRKLRSPATAIKAIPTLRLRRKCRANRTRAGGSRQFRGAGRRRHCRKYRLCSDTGWQPMARRQPQR